MAICIKFKEKVFVLIIFKLSNFAIVDLHRDNCTLHDGIPVEARRSAISTYKGKILAMRDHLAYHAVHTAHPQGAHIYIGSKQCALVVGGLALRHEKYQW